MNELDIIPAIDLMNGQVVRLQQGNPERATYYSGLGSAAQVAECWRDEGARYLHVVDLDAAMDLGNNRPQIFEIVKSVGTPMEVGGGIRTAGDIRAMLGLGVDRVILGTVALEKPEILVNSLTEFGSERIAVALDYVNDRVVIRGWKKDTGYSVENALSRFIELGVQTFLMTSVSRDGLLTGPDLETLARCAEHKFINILAAGGVGNLEDLRKLRTTGVKGVVVGKALYEGHFKLREALSLT